MKRFYRLAFSVLFAVGITGVAHANNSYVETMLTSYGDTSMFYQGLLNTGVINELRQDQHYTIFAPTNEAFTQVSRNNYPCFYAVECRPQIAAILRSHILLGTYPLADLVTYGNGIQTASGRAIFVQEPYVGDYTVDGRKILSTGEMAGNVVYRINGVIAEPQDLSPFTTVSYVPPAALTTEKTVVRKTYRTNEALPESYPGGAMTTTPGAVPDDASQTTTVTHTYRTESP